MTGAVFIDEMHNLHDPGYSKGDPYGTAIIETLLPFMENHRVDLVVFGAGYPMAMERMLTANQGLRRRFATTIVFESYTPDELWQLTWPRAWPWRWPMPSSAARAEERVEPLTLVENMFPPEVGVVGAVAGSAVREIVHPPADRGAGLEAALRATATTNQSGNGSSGVGRMVRNRHCASRSPRNEVPAPRSSPVRRPGLLPVR